MTRKKKRIETARKGPRKKVVSRGSDFSWVLQMSWKSGFSYQRIGKVGGETRVKGTTFEVKKNLLGARRLVGNRQGSRKRKKIQTWGNLGGEKGNRENVEG